MKLTPAPPVPVSAPEPKAPAEPEEEVPEIWELSSFHSDGTVENIAMTAAEFEQMKKYLKTLRSHKPNGKKSAA